MMTITNIRIKRNNKINDKLIGVASIQLDNCLVIHNIKLIQLKDRRIICFPSQKIKKYELTNSNNLEMKYEYSDIVHPSNSEFRKYIETELFKYYDMGGLTDNE